MPIKKEKQPLSVTHPELAKQADGWDPSSITSGSSQKLSWICTASHRWIASVNNRAGNKSGCPFCTGKSVLIGFNDLETTHTLIAAEAYGWDPRNYSAGSSRKMTWKCSNTHIWNATINDRTNGNSCPYCTGRKLLSGFNDLATKHPFLSSQAFGWDPSEVLTGSHKRLDWKCEYGHVWKSVLSSRINSSAGCPVCSGHKLLAGFNDLATTHPVMAAQADGWDPRTVQKGSRAIKGWICEEGHRWRNSPNSRTNMNAGCPTCAQSGFDPNLKSYLYFLKHTSWDMYQIGITNDIKRRLKEHSNNGWVEVDIRGPMDGHLTQQWETAILRMLKAKGADLSNSKIAGKFDGYSEAWSKSTFEANSIKELMRLTEEFEQNSLKSKDSRDRIRE